MEKRKSYSRRDFLKQMAAAPGLAAAVAPAMLPATAKEIPQRAWESQTIAPSDRLGLATIGMGIIGFVDTATALEVPGVELVAAADLYDGRRVRTNEIFGQQVATTRDYREILARADVDAVIVSTPDHWHARIAREAMQAGKHVYCEKPMVQKIDEGLNVIEAEHNTKRVLQVGSQFVNSIVYDKARELYRSGAIGELNLVEASWKRNSAIGAWQYSIPPDASPQTIDWDRFLGEAPKRPFDAMRFFRWRNYWDYGTGIPGDLFVHLFTAIHYVLSSNGPQHLMATGGLRYWKDGRDAPDVILGLYDYTEGKNHPAFTVSLSTNFVDGSGSESDLRLIGSEGLMSIGGQGVKVSRRGTHQPNESEVVEGYNSVRTFSEATQKEFIEKYRAEVASNPVRPQLDGAFEYKTPEGYDARLDHFHDFFDAIRSGRSVTEDATYGFRAAAPALLTNTSQLENRVIAWDPEKMKVVS